jgi:hypothetical protein
MSNRSVSSHRACWSLSMSGHLLRCHFGFASSRTTQYAAVRSHVPPCDPPPKIQMPEVPEGGI